MPAPHLRVREIRRYERGVKLRMPFRFGIVTLTEAPQTFVRARIALEDGREGWGLAAELLVPKWFDKNVTLSNEENFDQLRAALGVAAQLYTRDGAPRTAFGLFATHYRAQLAGCGAQGLNPLIASFGPALLDRAILDALCRLHGVSFFDAVRANLPGLAPAEFVPDLADFNFDAYLARARPRESIHARHTVGLLDPIMPGDQAEGMRVGDGLPETLQDVIAAYGHTYFKLKVGGDAAQDIARLSAIAAVLDTIPEPYSVTLDGNEQYADVEGVLELWRQMESAPGLRRLAASTLFIEQPIQRGMALERDVRLLTSRRPVIIDESDADFDAFPRARDRGYTGVSSKACKGFYKALINAARCEVWNRAEGKGTYFLSAEDLTTQAGVAVQQDLAIAAAIGIEHIERNGHHYVNGMAGAPNAEQEAFLAAHPDLYLARDGVVGLRIERGILSLRSLACPGFAVAAEPDWAGMQEMTMRPART
jgi:L-alanine-DL-glutamate epimerase-like enolase superfamily enzyme